MTTATRIGEKMTTISTPTTSDRADNKKWDTYSGTYRRRLDGVTTVRFTFKIASRPRNGIRGNCIWTTSIFSQFLQA